MNSQIPPLPGGPFSVADARASGVTAGRLRSKALARPFHGVRTLVQPVSAEAHCRAYATILPPDAAFSHQTAAHLHALPLPDALQHDTALDVTRPRRALAAAGVRGHQQPLDAGDVLTLRGLRLTTPGRTLCDLGSTGHLDLADLVAVADVIVGRSIRSPFERLEFTDDPHVGATLGELKAAFARWRGRRGRPLIGRALELADGRAESPQESRLRVRLVEGGLPVPELQHEVRDARGRFVARVDLAYPGRRVAIEYEGDHHRVQAQQWRRDIGRTRELEHLNWRVVRVTALDVADPRTLLHQLAPLLPRR